MHKWEHDGYEENPESKQFGKPIFKCRLCGFSQVSYVWPLTKALQRLYDANDRFRKCVPTLKGEKTNDNPM